MKLREIVVAKAILPRLASTSRDDVVAEMLDALIAAGALNADLRDEFLKAVIKREKRGSTGFGQGVAIPHVKSDRIRRVAVSIGVSATGVDFKALDRQPVHMVFLVLSPEDKPEEHLDAMQVIFATAGRPQFQRLLRQAATSEDVIGLLEEVDASQTVR
jgi:PTS system fructose-specific IIA component/PTS system nitrogen regulatory IIA component